MRGEGYLAEVRAGAHVLDGARGKRVHDVALAQLAWLGLGVGVGVGVGLGLGFGLGLG